MSDLKQYIEKRKQNDAVFAKGFESGYNDFKIGVLLRKAREAAGLTQEAVALQIGTKKSAISRIENHAENITLSTLKVYAEAVGYLLNIQLIGNYTEERRALIETQTPDETLTELRSYQATRAPRPQDFRPSPHELNSRR